MDANPAPSARPDGDAVTRMLQAIEEDRQAARRKAWRETLVLGVLIAFVVAYMAWIYRSLGVLDAESLTRIASTRIEGELPALRQRLKGQALQAAPKIMAQGRRMLLQAPALLREKAEDQLSLAFQKRVLDAFEQKLDAHLLQVLDRNLATARRALPKGTPEQRMEFLVTQTVGSHRAAFEEAVDDFHGSYAREMDRVNGFLKHLKTGRQLTETERLQKELIEVWVVLIGKHGILDPANR